MDDDTSVAFIQHFNDIPLANDDFKFPDLLIYLRLADPRLGLLINFGEALIKDGISRIANKKKNETTNQFSNFFAPSRLCVKTRICHAKALRHKVQKQLRINERVSYLQVRIGVEPKSVKIFDLQNRWATWTPVWSISRGVPVGPSIHACRPI